MFPIVGQVEREIVCDAMSESAAHIGKQVSHEVQGARLQIVHQYQYN